MAYYMNKNVPAKRGDIFTFPTPSATPQTRVIQREDQQSLSPLIN